MLDNADRVKREAEYLPQRDYPICWVPLGLLIQLNAIAIYYNYILLANLHIH